MGQPDKLQELNSDFAKICISPKPFGGPMSKVPLQVLKKLDDQATQNLSIINFAATTCNTSMEKCQDSLKSTFKRVKSQIQKGAKPEKAARRGYKNACDYFEMLDKRKPYSTESYSLPNQILSPYSPEGVVYHGQPYWPAKT